MSWEEIPGAAAAVEYLRREEIPFRLLTNTTTHTRNELASTLGAAGISVSAEEIVTAVVGTAAYLRANHPGARCFLLSDGDAGEDLPGVELVDDDPDVVVIGGASDDFSYRTIDRVFGMLVAGARLVAMHRNLYWRTSEGLQLDSGAYVRGLEEAAGVDATIVGKPAASFFRAALEPLDARAESAWMVGDDVENDVLAAQALGMTGVLVRTGKFREEDVAGDGGRPDHVVGSVADLPALLGAS
ncbi:MAG: HAD-IIA family hydrolase [Actinomycetota bacterium]|nr:HAD-IIA family hydrolase [Actinomycetota bacterium]